MALSFGDDMFFTEGEDGQLLVKNPIWIPHPESEEPPIEAGQIVLFTDYKSNVSVGREDSLKGKDVLVIPTRKRKIYIPLDEGEKIAECIFSMVRRLNEIKNTDTVGETTGS